MISVLSMFQAYGGVLFVILSGILVGTLFWRKVVQPKQGAAQYVLIGVVVGVCFFIFGGILLIKANPPSTYGPAEGPFLGFSNTPAGMERVQDIAQNPAAIPPPIKRNESATVDIFMEAKEVVAEVAEGKEMVYWTYDGRVPGPFLRVREGDTVNLTLKNAEANQFGHNIDLHAVTGPGGGATVTNVVPGEEKTFTFLAKHPGLYVYHCAHPNVAVHMAHGMYGLILVEPEEGLPKVDREFYLMQGELYAKNTFGRERFMTFDPHQMLDGVPSHVVFNGKTGGAVGNMSAKTGESIRLYVGNGGVNYLSSFHVIGEIFDAVYPEASMDGAPFRDVQTTVIPAGGATITEFGFDVPGTYVLVDHALARIDKGAWGTIEVAGQTDQGVFDGDNQHDHSTHDHGS